MTQTAQPLYKFGDSDLAAERLRLLATAFESSTLAFLRQLSAPEPFKTIADLGCGPGHTTRLLSATFPAASVVGIDNSPSFLRLARSTGTPRVSFALADVTQSLPAGPFSLIYARYLLTHLPKACAAIEHWSRHLAAGGLIAIEENQAIETEQPEFREYLSIVQGMLAADHQELFVGAKLDANASWGCLSKASSELRPLRLSRSVAASIFLPNLHTWRGRPFVQQNYETEVITRLEGKLQVLAQDRDDRPAITFHVRQIVLQLADNG